MRFRQNSTRTPYLNGRDQRRLLVLVAAFAGVLMAMDQARRPQVWAWMFPREQAPGARPMPAGSASGIATEPGPVAPGGDPAAARLAGLTLAPELFAEVRDDATGIERSDVPVIETLLAIDDQAVEWETALRDAPEYLPLIRYPAEHRGTPVQLSGELRLYGYARLPADAFAEPLVEGWIQTRDSGPNLYRVLFRHPLDGLAPGAATNAPIRVRGWFLKRQGTMTAAGLQSTPVVVAATAELKGRRPDENSASSLLTLFDQGKLGVWGFPLLGLGGVLTVIGTYWLSSRRPRRRPAAEPQACPDWSETDWSETNWSGITQPPQAP